MLVLTDYHAVNPALLAGPGSAWRQMLRIEDVGASVNVVIDAIQALQPQRLVYAEGDSWFDKFTPIPTSGTNLLAAIRTPFVTAVVDVSHIGDEVRDMVRGHQAMQTKAMFKLFDFNAVLLSAGGNDLKNVFADLFAAKAAALAGAPVPGKPADLGRLDDPASYEEFFTDVMTNVARFVDMRDAAGSATTRKAPIFVHGYDYFQPRPAGAAIFAGTRVGSGPWLYPSMKDAGLSDAQMRAAADAVIDELNLQLAQLIAPRAGVFVINSRGLLTPAAPQSTGSNADWLDEIHPNETGFTKLARNRWDVVLSQALGWVPNPGDLVPPLPVSNPSLALGGGAAAPVLA